MTSSSLWTVAKPLSLPSGGTAVDGVYRWIKRGGHAGRKVIERVVWAAQNAGWKHNVDSNNSPDGSTVGHGNTFVSPEGHKLRADAIYGATAGDNRYIITLTLAQPTVEGKQMKTLKLKQSQLRSLISEAIMGREVGSPLFEIQDADMDHQVARTVTDSFLSMLSPGVGDDIGDAMVHTLDQTLDDESFFPVRIEDVERMASAVASQAAKMIAGDPDFVGFLSDALAKSFRKGF